MNQFFLSLPAILGVVVFVIYFILKKSISEDPILKTILNKVRTKSPRAYSAFNSVTIKEREKLLRDDMSFRQILSLEELRVLEKALKNQFRTNIYVCSLCGFLLVAGIGLFIYQSLLPKPLIIDNIEIQDTDSAARKLLVDLDPVTVTWTMTGQDEEVYLALENAASGQQTKKIRVQASEGKIVFPHDPYDNYDKILNNRIPLESNRIRVIVYGSKQTFKSKEFEIKVGVQILALASLPNRVDFIEEVDNRQVSSYLYIPRLALFEGAGYDKPTYFEGREYASEHSFVIPHPETYFTDHYILVYASSQDDRIVRSTVELAEFLKLKK